MKDQQIQNSETLKRAGKSRTIFGRDVLLLGAVLGLVATGCQVLTYSGPNGERFSRSSFASKTTIASLTLEAETNGVRRVQLQGYQNDPTQALGIVTEAAVRAALQK
jgi:hypothetical protein